MVHALLEVLPVDIVVNAALEQDVHALAPEDDEYLP
jgi:hypothetical protein